MRQFLFAVIFLVSCQVWATEDLDVKAKNDCVLDLSGFTHTIYALGEIAEFAPFKPEHQKRVAELVSSLLPTTTEGFVTRDKKKLLVLLVRDAEGLAVVDNQKELYMKFMFADLTAIKIDRSGSGTLVVLQANETPVGTMHATLIFHNGWLKQYGITIKSEDSPQLISLLGPVLRTSIADDIATTRH